MPSQAATLTAKCGWNYPLPCPPVGREAAVQSAVRGPAGAPMMRAGMPLRGWPPTRI